MSAKYVALIVAAVALAACETAKPPEAASPSAPVITSPVQKRVVRGPIVPDDEPVVTTRSYAAPVASPASKPVAETPAAKAAVESTTTTAEAATGTVPEATGTEGSPAIGETSSGVSVSELAPPVSTAQPTPAATPTSSSWLPELSIGLMKDMMNANVGGFPLWLMVLIGIVLAAALIFGMSGGRREGETYAEPA